MNALDGYRVSPFGTDSRDHWHVVSNTDQFSVDGCVLALSMTIALCHQNQSLPHRLHTETGNAIGRREASEQKQVRLVGILVRMMVGIIEI